MGYVTSETIWIDRVILGFSAMFNFALFGLLLKQIRQKSKEGPKTSRNTSLSTHILIMNTVALSTMFFNGLFNIIRVPVSFGAFTFINCGFQSGLLCSLWTTGKYCLYLFFVSRVDVAFYYSAYSLSRTSFYGLYVFVTMGWIIQQIVIALTWKGVFIRLFGEPWQFCATATPVYVFIYLVIYDFIISMALLAIFVHKLHAASAQRHSISGHEISIFWGKISKYVTLTGVGVLSTIICMILVGVTSWITFTATDTNINSLCVFLMYGRNSSIFDKLCCCCYNYCGSKFVDKVTNSSIYKGSLKSKSNLSRTNISSHPSNTEITECETETIKNNVESV